MAHELQQIDSRFYEEHIEISKYGNNHLVRILHHIVKALYSEGFNYKITNTMENIKKNFYCSRYPSSNAIEAIQMTASYV